MYIVKGNVITSVLSEWYSAMFSDVYVGNANERWTYLPFQRQLVVKSNEQCLEVGTNKQTIQTAVCDTSNPDQRWNIDFTGGQVQHQGTGLCLGATKAVDLQPCTAHKILFGACQVFLDNFDFPGNDVQTTVRSTAEGCCSDCARTPMCNSIVWYEGKCYLKSLSETSSPGLFKLGARATRFGRPMVQATCPNVKLEESTEFIGTDLIIVRRDTALDCCAPCAQLLACNAFSFANGKCFLKSTGQNKTVSTNVVSARVWKCSVLEQNVDYVGDDIGLAKARTPEVPSYVRDCVLIHVRIIVIIE
jgi:hypothetical protein